MSRTSLTPYAASMRDPDPDGATRAARQAWHDHGIAVIRRADCERLDWEYVSAIADRVHGRRK